MWCGLWRQASAETTTADTAQEGTLGVITVEGTFISYDPTRRVVSAVLDSDGPAEGFLTMQRFAVGMDLAPVLNEQPVAMEALQQGDRLTLTATETVTAMEATRDPSAAAPVSTGVSDDQGLVPWTYAGRFVSYDPEHQEIQALCYQAPNIPVAAEVTPVLNGQPVAWDQLREGDRLTLTGGQTALDLGLASVTALVVARDPAGSTAHLSADLFSKPAESLSHPMLGTFVSYDSGQRAMKIQYNMQQYGGWEENVQGAEQRVAANVAPVLNGQPVAMEALQPGDQVTAHWVRYVTALAATRAP